MPNNKGSRVAASQARAKAAARKKTRAAGPDLSGATKPVEPSVEDIPETGEQEEESVLAVAQRATGGSARAQASSPYRRAATRRERQALTVVQAGSLVWELSWIFGLTATCLVALVLLRLFTTIGR